LVTDLCRPGAAGQEWLQRKVGGRLRLVNQADDEVLGTSAKSHTLILVSPKSTADRHLRLKTPDGGASRPGH
jgi:hypothetical protein